MTIYIVARNSDLTEGRGGDVPFAAFATEEAALATAKGQGVMGQGDGSIYVLKSELELMTTLNAANEGRITHTKSWMNLVTRVYGYRKNWLGKWDYGWLDLRDAPSKDPEYAEYQRLQKKFEGMLPK